MMSNIWGWIVVLLMVVVLFELHMVRAEHEALVQEVHLLANRQIQERGAIEQKLSLLLAPQDGCLVGVFMVPQWEGWAVFGDTRLCGKGLAFGDVVGPSILPNPLEVQ